jgi:hypothetical protein
VSRAAGLVIFAALVVACDPPGARFVDIPDHVAYVAWLELSAEGAVVDSSPIQPVAETRVVAVPENTFAVLIGFEEIIGAAANEAKLEAANACGPRLPAPAWQHMLSAAAGPEIPELTAPWVVELCDRGAPLPGIECSCEPSCAPVELEHATLTFGRDLRGIARVSDETFVITVPPELIALVSFDPTKRLHDQILAIDEPWELMSETIGHPVIGGAHIYVATQDGGVLELETSGSGVRRIEAKEGKLVLAETEPGSPILVFEIDGPAFEITTSSTVAVLRPDLPDRILDLASTPSVIAALTENSIYLSNRAERLPLPPFFPPFDLDHFRRDINDRPRIILAGGDLVLGAKDADVHRYRFAEEKWETLGWPHEVASRPRGLAAFAGGVLIGGLSFDKKGQIVLALPDRTCIWASRYQVNALSARPGDRTAYAVTSGGFNQYLIEVPAQ